MVLDDGGTVLGYACRCWVVQRRDFQKVFEERILPNLQLEQERIGVLRHHHRTYADESFLISYRAVRHEGRRHYLVAHHDTGYMVREVFPTLFVQEEERISYNVVDDDSELVFGQSRITRAGDYLVARRFPSTLYGWRLQIAPKLAPSLIVREEQRLYTETALISLSFVIVLLGVAFLIYAAVKESRLNALRSEFIANVSHELKTPLSVVRMFSEMLMTGRVRDDAKRAEYLSIIARESERLTALIDNVLDFSAIERGKQTYQMREGELHEVVARAIETFRYRIEKDGVEVKLEQKGDIPPVRFDEQAILLAVMNLLDNAIKYGSISKGGETPPPIEVSIERGRRHAYVRVRDHGPGIPAEHVKRVFDRFFRIRSHTGSVRGSGIGLSLVKRIVEAHRGRAWAENAEGGGAIVSFSVPLAEFSSSAGTIESARASWRSEPEDRPGDDRT